MRMFIAKNLNGEVILYYRKPIFKNGHYLSQDGKYFNVSSDFGKSLKKGECVECYINFAPTND